MTEYATRVGMHHAAATVIHVPNGDLAVVHLHRAAGLPVFSPQDIARLDLYRPHVARSAMLAARWRLERLRAAGDALALVGLPAAVLDERRQVIFANALMQEGAPWLVWLPADRIALSDVSANRLLQVALNEAHDPQALSVRSIPIKPTASTGAAVAHVIPAVGSARDLFEGGLAMMVITPANGSGAPSDSLLRALFDLTPSEARIARGIAEGATLEEMAAGHAVTVGTIRAQAKSVFAKTGMHRQAQVATLLVGLGKIR
jgi:DNA-binding CsgD family transcriptional regulator